MNNPQLEIMAHFLRGESLTVLQALRLYHTTELRRVISRINPELIRDGKMIQGEKLNGEKFKTYRLVNTLQLRIAI